MNKNYGYLNDEYAKKCGRPIFSKTALLTIMLYDYDDDVNSCKKLSEYDTNKYYNYLTDDLIPFKHTL